MVVVHEKAEPVSSGLQVKRDFVSVQIKKICNELGLGHRVNALIAELKGSGVMSPKLSSLAEVARTGSPIYELNPSLFVKQGNIKDEFTERDRHDPSRGGTHSQGDQRQMPSLLVE